MSGSASGETKPLYFVPRNNTFTEDATGGVSEIQLESLSPKRRVGGPANRQADQPQQPWSLFGWLSGGYTRVPLQIGADVDHRASLARKVPIKVEPKVFFANERTFIAWLHMAIILASISVGILTLAEKEGDSVSTAQIYGLILMPVAIAFCVYALVVYMKRAAMLRRRDPGPWEDRVGPTVLGLVLIAAIVASFGVKAAAIYG